MPYAPCPMLYVNRLSVTKQAGSIDQVAKIITENKRYIWQRIRPE
jgi:hypothetical protein